MLFSLHILNHTYTFDSEDGIDCSIPLRFDGQGPNAFGLPRAAATVAEGGGFVGDTRRGGSCNCETVTLNPHGNGTHTECIGHISRERFAVADIVGNALVASLVITVDPSNSGRVTRAMIDAAIARTGVDIAEECGDALKGLLIRTLPNDPDKRSRDYTGTNPPWIETDAMVRLRELGIEHLAVDLPSVDREDDPVLQSHRLFWDADADGNVTSESARGRTITEMIYLPDRVLDGLYLLNLQIPPFVLDAAPSRPILFRLM